MTSGKSEARLAATVVVLRPAATASGGAPEILMVRRARGQSFMAEAFVFPGGRVDPSDGEMDEDRFRNAAVRELREEAAVTLDARALVPLSRWVTPSAEPKRFDARFFVALAPAGTEARVDATEVTEHMWATAEELLARQARGELMLPPPTLYTLHELSAYADAAAILAWAASRPIEPIQPKLVSEDEVVHIVLPWDPAYASLPDEGAPILGTSLLASGPSRYVLRDGRFWATSSHDKVMPLHKVTPP